MWLIEWQYQWPWVILTLTSAVWKCLSTSGNRTRIDYDMCIHETESIVLWCFISTVVSKLNDFSRSAGRHAGPTLWKCHYSRNAGARWTLMANVISLGYLIVTSGYRLPLFLRSFQHLQDFKCIQNIMCVCSISLISTDGSASRVPRRQLSFLLLHQVCVQPPTYADNVPLPAFARRCCSNRSISPARRAHSNKPAATGLLLRANVGIDRQTDGVCGHMLTGQVLTAHTTK